MSAYRVLLSDDARADIDSLTTVILFEYQAPLTAFRYIQGLLDTILSLEKSAESFPLQTHPSLLKYGHYVRRVNYKRMAIFYTVHGSTVYIHRVLAASLINEL